MTLRALTRLAFGQREISGGPAWLDSRRPVFDRTGLVVDHAELPTPD